MVMAAESCALCSSIGLTSAEGGQRTVLFGRGFHSRNAR